MSTRKPTKSTKPPAPSPPEVPAPRSNLADVGLRIAASKHGDGFRPSIHVTLGGARFRLRVPGGRCATREKALATAEAYRAEILAADYLPPRPERFGWSSDEGLTLRHADGTLVD